MKPMIRMLMLAATFVCLGAGTAAAFGYKLVKPGEAIVARETMAVKPAIAWNKAPRPYTLPRTAEVWTQDGLPLNELTFYGGIEEGKKIIRQAVVGKEQPLPTFKAAMLPQEVVEFVENSLRIASGTTEFTVTSLKPIQFAGSDGFQFDYATISTDDVKRRGRVAGGIYAGKLYLLLYEAASLHYFDRYTAEVDGLIASLRVLPPKPAGKR